MSDLNFESLLAEQNAAYQEAKEFNDWMPNDGEYVIVVTAADSGTKAMDDGSQMLWWKHTAEILAGEDADNMIGKTFGSGFFSSRSYGSAKTNAKVLNGGDTPASLPELNEVLTSAVGKILKCEVLTRFSKKANQDYTNCYYRELVETEAVETGAPSEPPQEPDAAGLSPTDVLPSDPH